MAFASKTQLCNLALAELSARRINSIDADETVEAKACRLHFDHVVDTLLRRHQWSFASARKTLSQVSGFTSTEWATAWQLPSDFVRLIRIPSGDPHAPIRSFAIEGRHLLVSGLDTVEILYVSNAVPIPYWDVLFIDAVKFSLAAAIAGDVSKNPDLADRATTKLQQLALPAAQTADAREVGSGENFGPRALAAKSGLVAARFRMDGRPPFVPGNSRTPELP